MIPGASRLSDAHTHHRTSSNNNFGGTPMYYERANDVIQCSTSVPFRPENQYEMAAGGEWIAGPVGHQLHASK